MKKLITFILATILLCNITTAMADETLENLSALGLISESQMALNPDDFITREDFAFMAAHLLQEGDIPASNTRFSDVDATNANSGYIEFLAGHGIVNGVDGAEFYPKAKVNMGMAYKVVIGILGYDELAKAKGGYPDGYISIAQSLGISKNVTSKEGCLTNKGAINLVYNTLYTKTPALSQVSGDGGVVYDSDKNKDSNLLNDRLGISVYQGTILSVNQTKHSALFSVEKNKYDANPVLLSQGEEVVFYADGAINIGSYCNLPVTIWVNREEKIVHMTIQNGYSVKYAVIDSVNGDKSEDSSYKISHINRMTFLDDQEEYNVIDNAKLLFNEKAAAIPVRLAGKLARIILYNNAVSQIETWDFKEGGLIQKIEETRIVYMQSGGSPSILNDYDDYKLKVFIDGREASILELKPNSVFQYYLDSDYLVLAVSERVITGELKGIGDSELEIGDFYCKYEEYAVKKGEQFEKNADLSDFFGITMKAYLAPNGHVTHLVAVDETVLKIEFFGVIKGYQAEKLKDEVKVKIQCIKPEIKEIECILTSKTKYGSNLNQSVVLAGKGVASNQGVYVFEVNSTGKVTSVKNPEPFSGFFGQTTVTLAALPDTSNPLVYIDSRPIYFKGSDIVALYQQDGVLCAEKVNWLDVSASLGTINVTFYGEPYNSIPTLVLLHGNNLSNFGGKNYKIWGVVSKDKTSLSMDEEGNEIVNLAVMQDNATPVYKVSKETYNSIFASGNYALIGYHMNVPFLDADIKIITITPLANNFDNWTTVSPTYTAADGSAIDPTEAHKKAVKIEGLHKGTVQKADSLRLYVTEFGADVAQFFHPNRNFFLAVSRKSDGTLKFSYLKREEIAQGDTVYYNLSSDGIRGVIVVK